MALQGSEDVGEILQGLGVARICRYNRGDQVMSFLVLALLRPQNSEHVTDISEYLSVKSFCAGQVTLPVKLHCFVHQVSIQVSPRFD